MVAAFVEVLQKVVVGCQVNAFEVIIPYNLRNTACTVFIESIEGEFLDLSSTEVSIVVLGDDILDKMVFCFGYLAIGSFPNQHDKVLQEAYLLDVQLLSLDGERVHRDRMLFGIADVLAIDIVAESFV